MAVYGLGVPLPDHQIAQNDTGAADAALAAAHAELVADQQLQFDRVGFVPPEVPGWLHWIRDAIAALGPFLKVAFWVGLGLIVAAIVYVLVREILRLRLPRPKADEIAPETEVEWRPDAATARNLLADADALASDGRYAEAAHLLLARSVEDIEQRLPRAIGVSLTTREIAQLNRLPEAARPSFAQIGRVVERSLFGGRPVDAQDFADCRRAYEDFALPGGWRS